MARKTTSFRVGRVRGDLRGQVWYLTYHENGKRHRSRSGQDLAEAKKLASQINVQVETGVPAVLSFDSISIDDLRTRWLDHHEHVTRSSVHTIKRYRSATQHLINFLSQHRVPQVTAQFRLEHAEQFARYLRTLEVTSNGHPHSVSRPLLDKGVLYILHCCRSLFNFAIKRRHLPPYSDNPFSNLEFDRMSVEDSKPIILFTSDQEMRFLQQCDDWQVSLFLTLMLTGMRPGEMTHLLLPDDVNFEQSVLQINNRPQLGWQIKTRIAREIPLVDELCQILQFITRGRSSGTLLQRRQFAENTRQIENPIPANMERELQQRLVVQKTDEPTGLDRVARLRICRTVWRDAGAIKIEQVRSEFIRVCERAGLQGFTSPKMLRHLFATTLQDANVDPLIRCELMGHSTANQSSSHNLGMTANYTHTRFETKRKQLQFALDSRAATAFAREWLQQHA